MNSSDIVPVILFAYARPNHLQRTLNSLRENNVPRIYAYSDGPRTQDKVAGVAEVRQMLREIDWCEIVLVEREENLGLGASIQAGVADVLKYHAAVLVCEDDLVFVPGSYEYLCAALRHYRDDKRVMSVTGWTHSRVTPNNVRDMPYFDGRAECLLWGTWARSWKGMDQSALSIREACRQRGIDIHKYGADLSEMAEIEIVRNIWAVRFLYLHILRGGLCMRPPWSLVEHIGFDALATNADVSDGWDNEQLHSVPPIPTSWPEPIENEHCADLWQKAYGRYPWVQKVRRLVVRNLKWFLG